MKKLKGRIFLDRVFFFTIVALSTITIVPLFLILFHIIKNGISAINWDFFFSRPKRTGEEGGGISNAIVGSAIIVGIATLLSVPLGVFTGVYLSENRETKLSNVVRTLTEILQSTPSIVMGIIGYIWLVRTMGTFSALAGGIALGIMMLPIIVRTTEEVLNLIPEDMKEASYALGVPYHRTILKVVLPAGFNGIMSGILLGISRIAGETAPLLFTSFGNQFMNLNILKPMSAIPLVIFVYSSSPYPDWWRMAWGASFILVIFVLILNILGRLLGTRWKTRF